MAWIDLLVAGVFEVVWSTCLKYSHGFTNVMFTVLTFIGMGFSFWFLAHFCGNAFNRHYRFKTDIRPVN